MPFQLEFGIAFISLNHLHSELSTTKATTEKDYCFQKAKYNIIMHLNFILKSKCVCIVHNHSYFHSKKFEYVAKFGVSMHHCNCFYGNIKNLKSSSALLHI